MRRGSSVVEQGTHKPLVGSSTLPPGTILSVCAPCRRDPPQNYRNGLRSRARPRILAGVGAGSMALGRGAQVDGVDRPGGLVDRRGPGSAARPIEDENDDEERSLRMIRPDTERA